MKSEHDLCGCDEAAAICIGKWAVHAGEVGAVLTKKAQL